LEPGSTFEIVNPKDGSRLETKVGIAEENQAGRLLKFETAEGDLVAQLRYKSVTPNPEKPSPNTLYGNPRQQQSHLWLDFLRVEPGFQGKGVRESIVEGLRTKSIEMGHEGRIKLQCANEFGTVSAIPWYKAGFRPQEGACYFGENFTTTAQLLETTALSGRRITLEEGSKFNNLLMYLPQGK
jgi:hypothetical protein